MAGPGGWLREDCYEDFSPLMLASSCPLQWTTLMCSLKYLLAGSWIFECKKKKCLLKYPLVQTVDGFVCSLNLSEGSLPQCLFQPLFRVWNWAALREILLSSEFHVYIHKVLSSLLTPARPNSIFIYTRTGHCHILRHIFIPEEGNTEGGQRRLRYVHIVWYTCVDNSLEPDEILRLTSKGRYSEQLLFTAYWDWWSCGQNHL